MVEIRILTKNDDFTDLISLSRQFFGEYAAFHNDFFAIEKLTDEDITSYFTSFCSEETRAAFIAIEERRIVGYITAYVKDQPEYWKIKQVGEISGFMVQPEHRRQGIGRELLCQARNFLASHGIRFFTLYTSVVNKVALDFYTHNGMTPLYSTLLGET